jgi:2-keto-3-deoxygluconate permease.
MDMTNGGLYAAVMQQYGSKEEAGAFVLMSIESGPLVSMIILGATGVAFFEPRLFVGAVLPFLIGFALGNLDSELREFFGRCVHPLIPFFGFALGNGIDLNVIVTSGLPGVVLGLGVIVVTGIPLILADRWIAGGNGAAGLGGFVDGGGRGGEPGDHRRDDSALQAAGAGCDGDGRDRVSRDGGSCADSYRVMGASASSA